MFQLPVSRSLKSPTTNHDFGAKKHQLNLKGFNHSAHKKNVEHVPIVTEANKNLASMASMF